MTNRKNGLVKRDSVFPDPKLHRRTVRSAFKEICESYKQKILSFSHLGQDLKKYILCINLNLQHKKNYLFSGWLMYLCMCERLFEIDSTLFQGAKYLHARMRAERR